MPTDYFVYNGNTNLKKPGAEIEWDEEKVREYIKCKNDPIYFLRNYMKVTHPDRGFVPFEPYSYQEDMIKKFIDHRFNIVLSSRQSGKTTSYVGFILHYILFNSYKSVAILANNGKNTSEILKRVKDAYEALPEFIQQGVFLWNKTKIELENGSTVMSSTTSSDSVRSYALSCVIIDECAFIPSNIWEDFYASTWPTISSAKKSKFILVSTPKGMNHFYKIWKKSERGQNDFVRTKVHWSDVPGRDKAWKKIEIDNTSERQFLQEHELHFLGSSNTLIDVYKLENLVYDSPIIESEGGETNIYEEPIEGHNYLLTVDGSEGKGQDYSVISVFDVTSIPYKHVAVYRSNTIEPNILPDYIENFAKKYNDAYVLIETDSVGMELAQILVYDNEYENIFYTETKGRAGQKISLWPKDGTKPGIKMTKSVKKMGCINLKQMIENDKLIIHDYNTINELTKFVKKKSSYAAEDGRNEHDDIVMTLVSFAWMVNQKIFKDFTDTDFVESLKKERLEGLPVGFFDGNDDGKEKIPGYKPASYGNNSGNLNRSNSDPGMSLEDLCF